MKKALFVATVYGFLDFEYSDIRILKEMGFEVHTATNMQGVDWLKDNGTLDNLIVKKHQIDFGRTPFSNRNISAYKQLKTLLDTETFDIIHCHTPVAATIVRLAAREVRKKGTKIIYSAHGFHFHRSAPLINWLIFYPIEYILSWTTDMIITINREDYSVAQKFHTRYVRYIPGVGVDTEHIAKMKAERHETILKNYGISDGDFVILSVGELSERKNHSIIIKALGQLDRSNVRYIIVGAGENEQKLRELAVKCGVDKQVFLTGRLQHDDVLQIGHVVDLGAVPSLIEGLGLTGIEILAAGTPLIGSNIQGIKDYIIDDETGILCNPKSEVEFANAIRKMMDDNAYYQKCKNNAEKVAKQFDIKAIEKMMKENYELVLNN